MKSVIVIGAGLFGSIIAKELRSKGHFVTVIDAKKEGSGSKPAACLMKPSWFSSLGKEVYTPALETLDRLYGLREVKFGVIPVKWIPPVEILLEPDIEGEVTEIHQTEDGWSTRVFSQEFPIQANILIVAAGIWCNEIIKYPKVQLVPGLSTRQGIAWITPDYEIPHPFILPWAPFKQIVSFNREPGKGWISDGTAVKDLNAIRREASLIRCRKALGNPPVTFNGILGNRPYTPEAKPCYLQQHAHNLWVATGGAKNGTIAAGWAAHQLGRMI